MRPPQRLSSTRIPRTRMGRTDPSASFRSSSRLVYLPFVLCTSSDLPWCSWWIVPRVDGWMDGSGTSPLGSTTCELRIFANAMGSERDGWRTKLTELVQEGRLRCEWNELKESIQGGLAQAVEQYAKKDKARKEERKEKAVGPSKAEAVEEHLKEFEERILQKLDEFEDGPPFTVQRICELLLNPVEQYPKFEHFELALERQLNVTSTVSYRAENGHGTSSEKHHLGTPQAFAEYFHQEKHA